MTAGGGVAAVIHHDVVEVRRLQAADQREAAEAHEQVAVTIERNHPLAPAHRQAEGDRGNLAHRAEHVEGA